MTAHRPVPYRVVVADDSSIFRTALVRFLATLPEIQVIAEAANGEEAVQIVKAMSPDLLILDIQMPKMNGLEVLRHLKAMATKVQVVVLSAHGCSYADQVLENGASTFVHKGNVPQLLNTLSTLLKHTTLT